VFVIFNVALLAAGYRISYEVRTWQAALLGLGSGILMALNQCLWMSHRMRFSQVAAIALAEILVLVPAYALAARRGGILILLLNLAVGAAGVLILPFVVLDWVS
jgi:hypothetical protein